MDDYTVIVLTSILALTTIIVTGLLILGGVI